LTLEDVTDIGCPETLVPNYKSMLCNIPEEQRSQTAHSSVTLTEGTKIQFYVHAS
jgi:hypothetical protein